MHCEMIVEQLGSQEYRMRYDGARDVFVQTRHRYLGHERGFKGIYGWIDGYGVPPGKHLDVMVPTNRGYSLGKSVPIQIVGCFKRGDADHKFIGVEANRQERTLSELPESEREMLHSIYPETREGDAWLEREHAVALIGCHRA
jgi:hypothetical protein